MNSACDVQVFIPSASPWSKQSKTFSAATASSDPPKPGILSKDKHHNQNIIILITAWNVDEAVSRWHPSSEPKNPSGLKGIRSHVLAIPIQNQYNFVQKQNPPLVLVTLECCLWVSAKSVIYWQSHKPSQATNADKQRPSNSQKLSTGSKMQLICGLNCILKLTEAKHTSIGQPFSFTFQVSPLHILKGIFVAVICSYIVTLMKMNDSHAENDLQRKAKKKKNRKSNVLHTLKGATLGQFKQYSIRIN